MTITLDGDWVIDNLGWRGPLHFVLRWIIPKRRLSCRAIVSVFFAILIFSFKIVALLFDACAFCHYGVGLGEGRGWGGGGGEGGEGNWWWVGSMSLGKAEMVERERHSQTDTDTDTPPETCPIHKPPASPPPLSVSHSSSLF